MVRFAASVLAVLSFLTPAAAQTPPTTTASPAQTATPAKPAAKKAATKPKATAAKPAEPASAGPCGIGVIAATQDLFVVQKIGLTVFGNDYTEVPVS